MGCFPACFRLWRHKQTMKNAQDQCMSPSNESSKLLPVSMESLKEEDIVNSIEVVPLSDNGETAVFDQSTLNKGSNNNDDKLEETENEGIEHKDDESESIFSSFLIDDKDCVTIKVEHKDDGSESKFSSLLINDKDCGVEHKDDGSESKFSDCVTKEVTFVQEESSDSLFSLSIESRRPVFAVEMDDKEVNSPLLSSCHVLKYDEDKENVALSRDPIIKQSYGKSIDHQLKKRESEIAVDTSLSSWLVASEKSNKKTSRDSSPQSEKNYGEREILGAITSATEYKELNGISSGGCSSDDQLGIGTVGRPELLAEVC